MAKLMIIDDDIDAADGLAEALKAKGHDVRTLNETGQAIEELIMDTPDLLILDLMFPDDQSAGFSLAREIRGREKIAGLPVILLTGVNQEFSMDFSGEDIDPVWMPVQEFMEKPVSVPLLLDKISQILGTGDAQ